MADTVSSAERKNKTIWIDLENSPHVLFFNPIVNELKKRGWKVLVTVRDYAQVIGLCNLFHLEYTKIGHHYGKNKIAKSVGLVVRSLQLLPVLMKEKPCIAVSHGSRSQIVVSNLVGLPTIMMYDYEYTKKIPFFRPTLAIVPEMLRDEDVKDSADRISRYPGIKEDVYAANLVPDSSILKQLGIHEEELIITIRPPATEAHYHNSKSDELFSAVMNHIIRTSNTKIIIMPRTEKQRHEIQTTWAESVRNSQIIMPEQVVDGLNLIWHSDIVISAGGTMIREAAALSVPAYSIFGGKIGAVDRYLNETGRLTFIGGVDEITSKLDLSKRKKTNIRSNTNSSPLYTIVEKIINAAEK